MPSASTGASTAVAASSAVADPTDSRMAPGGPGYRRMSFALFLAGVATFALLYSTQALLPLVSADFGGERELRPAGRCRRRPAGWRCSCCR